MSIIDWFFPFLWHNYQMQLTGMATHCWLGSRLARPCLLHGGPLIKCQKHLLMGCTYSGCCCWKQHLPVSITVLGFCQLHFMATYEIFSHLKDWSTGSTRGDMKGMWERIQLVSGKVTDYLASGSVLFLVLLLDHTWWCSGITPGMLRGLYGWPCAR